MGYRMVEAEHISMQAKTTAWIIAITILNVTTNWVSHIGSMHTNLVLSTRLQLIFHQRMLGGALHGMEMGNGVLAAIVRIAGISDIKLYVPEQWSHDANLVYAIQGGRYNVSIEANNFTNALLYDNYSLQKPGRSFSIKFRYVFYKQ